MKHIMNSSSKLWFRLSFLSFLLIVSCKDDEGGFGITNHFRVLQFNVAGSTLTSGATDIFAGAAVELVFSHEVNSSALESAILLSPSVGLSFAYDESGSIATITPIEPLDYSTSYTISLPAGVYGADGEKSNEAFSFEFTTAPFDPPSVSLSADFNSAEEGESITITASLDAASLEDVTVNLAFTGSATLDADYSVDTQSIVISAGDDSGVAVISLTDDTDVEGAESFQVSISGITNGEDVSDPINIAILDNDLALGLSIKGVMALIWTTSDTNGGKAVHLVATEDVPDLSVYSLGVANNGGGTDGIEFTLPSMSANAGDDILIAREQATLSAYFGGASEFEIIIETEAMNQNGDDAIELFSGETVIETYGDINVDGTGQDWEYTGTWAYKLGGEWLSGTLDCAATSTTTADSDCTYPMMGNALQLQGVMALRITPGAEPNYNLTRAIHLRANRDIADLSVYGIGIPNNGGGTDGREMDLPAISVSEGDQILFVRDEDLDDIPIYFESCYNGWDEVHVNAGINFNGDDGVELYEGDNVIEIYGSIDDDGTGLFWEYDGAWAYKQQGGDVWTYGGVSCALAADTNANAGCSYPFCD